MPAPPRPSAPGYDEGAVETDEHLRWEARRRPQAAIAAALGGLLTLASIVVGAAALHGAPQQTKRLDRPALERFHAHQLLFEHQHPAAYVASAVLLALGALAAAYALTFLYRAIKARRPEYPAAIRFAPILGGVVYGVAVLVVQLTLVIDSGRFADHAHTFAQAKASPALLGQAYDYFHSGPAASAGLAALIGQLLLGLAFVLLAIGALRVGLLPRLMGYAGAIAGVVVVIPLGPLIYIQILWLVALASLFVGRWPGGVPLAWTTGRAEVLPSMAEQRERQARAREARRSGGRATAGNGALSRAEQAVQRRLLGDRPPEEPARVAATPGAEPEARSPHPATSKRKRKRKRH